MATWQHISAEEGDALIQLGANVQYRTKQGRGYAWRAKSRTSITFVDRAALLKRVVEFGAGYYRNNVGALVPESLEVRVEVDG